MAISDAQFTAWLSNNAAVRCIIVEATARVSGIETVRYLSSKPYTDNVANRIYQPVILGNSVEITEKLSIDSLGALTFGDIEISNADGALDNWLEDVWVNRVVNVLLGDVTWPRADFRFVLKGITADLDSRDRITLNIKVRDKLQRLNTPVSEAVLGGTTKNKEELIPLTFGEVHNALPLLSNPATLEYQVHDGHIQGIIEVRDEGVPVPMVDYPIAGKFMMAATPFGRITCSIQGDKEGNTTYRNTVKTLIERIVKGYGEVSSRFVDDDLDLVQLAAFETANPQPVGIYVSDRSNVLSICSQLAVSVGAQMVMSRQGKLQLIKIELPAPGTPVNISEKDIISNTLQIAARLEVQAAQKIAFNKNWNVQKGLETGIPNAHKEMFEQEWLTIISEDAGVKSTYKIDGEPEQIETMLLREVEAEPEAIRLRDLYKVPRMILSFEGTPNLMELSLGGAVVITHSRFGLSGGKDGIVLSQSINWSNMRVKLEVLV